MPKTLKKELHELVDDLPPAGIPAARRYLDYLRDLGSDPVLRAAHAAPVDDEEETPGERAKVDEARKAAIRGKLKSDKDVHRQLHL
jgi:hypothetical protein